MSAVETPRETNWRRKLVLTALAIGAVILLGLIASATIPRWWAQQVGDQVDGIIGTGTLVGLF
ncbi:MAG: hypothetical protein ACRDQT_03255, partial [Gaiellaceae bacterium]